MAETERAEDGVASGCNDLLLLLPPTSSTTSASSSPKKKSPQLFLLFPAQIEAGLWRRRQPHERLASSPYWARLTDAAASFSRCRRRGLRSRSDSESCHGLRHGKQAAILYGSRTVISHDPDRPGAALHVEPLAPFDICPGWGNRHLISGRPPSDPPESML